ncbi:MAG: DUF3160 domain-containing protein [Lachnospiraceae bacterium]|nr:DUF3160 domain-containing protein [Lachnospiraceae bacterium]
MKGKKRKFKKNSKLVVAIIAMTAVFLAACGKDSKKITPGEDGTTNSTTESTDTTTEIQSVGDMKVTYIHRPSLVSGTAGKTYGAATAASVTEYSISPDFEGVYDNDRVLNMTDNQKEFLSTNGFVVVPGWNNEFFEIYEDNRYGYHSNFITVDSMMHTYHLYFAFLLRTTEKQHLSADLSTLSAQMLEASQAQYDKLKGTEWEQAAKNNLAFFAVGSKLLDPNAQLPADVSAVAEQELALINAAAELTESPLFTTSNEPVYEDYTQYKPRGYYDGDELLERYFRAMMWYGRRNFAVKDETQARSALLMTLAMEGDALANWEKIYVVTSFFAGASDDCGYYEFRPIIEAAYGKDISVDKLPGNTAGWDNYITLTKELEPPQINSVPVYASDSDEEVEDKITGYRFMGQRFSIDESIFTQLVYRNTQENSAGENRMLPNALDVPAALGSDAALSILTDMGETDYKNYNENMTKLREEISNASSETWDASLYSSWINTLRPLLKAKKEGYPIFMQSEEWNKKNLQTFLGSYTELKHDTVLYSKQMVAEMGGGEIPELDDRGYVEPEFEVYSRLADLVRATSEGLESYGYLSADSKSDLEILADLSDKLATISGKELRNELLTDDEYELIRTFGGQLEHFWQEATKDQAGTDYFTTNEFPAAIVTDIATDPNGACLEVGTGRVNVIYVIVPVDGQLKVASGPVYSYYEFAQPISDRLTDKEWRRMLGMEVGEDGEWNGGEVLVDRAEWTNSFIKEYEWGN